jgi:hypothetical protein
VSPNSPTHNLQSSYKEQNNILLPTHSSISHTKTKIQQQEPFFPQQNWHRLRR